MPPASRTGLIDHREMLRPVLAELSPRDRTILGLQFFHQQTQTQIAEQISISQVHVYRVLRKKLTLLRNGITAQNDHMPRRY